MSEITIDNKNPLFEGLEDKIYAARYHSLIIDDETFPEDLKVIGRDEKGQIIIAKEDCEMDADDLMMIALDAGAEDFNEEEDCFEVLTSPDDFEAVRSALEAENIPMAEAEVTMIPQNYVELSADEDITNINLILDLLDDDDDVQQVYHNWDE